MVPSMPSLEQEVDPEDYLTEGDYEDINCLARNIFFEARDQSYEGQKAVATVTFNRVGKYGSDICGVVYAPYQFSWTFKIPPEEQDQMILDEFNKWEISIRIAKLLYLHPKFRSHLLNKQTHFLNPSEVKRLPDWYRNFSYNYVKIGDHIFVQVRGA